MSTNEFFAQDTLDISVDREEDEYGAIIVKIKADGDVITINCGRFQEDAEGLADELTNAMHQAEHVRDSWEDLPDNEADAFVTEDRGGYAISMEQRYIASYPSRDIATYELARAMAEAMHTPTAWYVNERGNYDLISDQVNGYLDAEDKLRPLPGVRYEDYVSVQLAGDDWPRWTVDKDYGDLGVMIHTAGDPSVTRLATHDELTPYDDDDECE